MNSFFKVIAALAAAALAVLAALAVIDLITRDDGKNILLKNLKPRKRSDNDVEVIFERGGQAAADAFDELADVVEDTAEELADELADAVEDIELSEDDLDGLIG